MLIFFFLTSGESKQIDIHFHIFGDKTILNISGMFINICDKIEKILFIKLLAYHSNPFGSGLKEDTYYVLLFTKIEH